MEPLPPLCGQDRLLGLLASTRSQASDPRTTIIVFTFYFTIQDTKPLKMTIKKWLTFNIFLFDAEVLKIKSNT